MTKPTEPQLRPIVTRSGTQTYIPRKPCKRGHMLRYVISRACVECRAADGIARYAADPQAVINKVKNWALANPHRKRDPAKAKAWWLANPGKSKEYYLAHRETVLEKAAKRRAANPDKESARCERYRRLNPDKESVRRRNRRARKATADGSYTASDVRDLFDKQRGRCAYCTKPIKNGYHCDHIVPLAKGGSNWISNIALSCQRCNLSKGAKDPLIFARQIGRLL